MAIKTNKSIFYHIPKTGGVFVRETMRRSMKGMENFKYERPQLDYGVVDDLTHWKRFAAHTILLKRTHETPWGIKEGDKKGLFSFTFVRKPLPWYKSFWADRKGARNAGFFTNAAFPLDFAWDVDFEKFVSNALNMFPRGFMTTVFQCFIGKSGDDLDFVGRQENLREDLVKALTLAGENFDERIIRTMKKFNVRASNPKFSVNESFYISKGLERKLMKTEKWVINTFYKKE